MGCPLNKKKFLWFEYEGKHDYIISEDSISKWASRYWEYDWFCTQCKNRIYEFGVSHAEMVRKGLITPDGDVITKERTNDKSE